MKKHEKVSFPYVVARFFRMYLPGERGFSTNTISSYRDTFKQFFEFYRRYTGKEPDALQMEELSKSLVKEFLTQMEKDGKSIATRNQRLAALKSFFSFVKYEYPEYIDIVSDIIAIRMKKQPEQTVSYMIPEGVRLLLEQPDIHTKSGYRDMLLLALMYDSGARVSEIIQVRIGDIRMKNPATILLHGKGQKDRIVPLSSKTADLIGNYIHCEHKDLAEFHDKLLFTNRGGNQLTRAGVAYILKKYITKASAENPDIVPERFSPHCLRHSKAMHLLQAGVAIIYIRDFLGHSSIKTTELYAKTDNKNKREALDKAYQVTYDTPQDTENLWNDDDSLMTFLESLLKNPN